MKQITFYYVRHGRTEFNKAGIIQGQVDSPLCPEGIPVLQETGSILKDIPFNVCYSSPFQRAISTAEIILEGRDIPIIPLESLKEMSFGSIDGKPHKEHKQELRNGHIFDSFRHVGGESADDVRKRVRQAFNLMVSSAKDKDQVLITCHGSYYRYILYELMHKNRFILKLDPAYTGTANGSVSVFTYTDGRYQLECYPLTGDSLRSFLRNRTAY